MRKPSGSFKALDEHGQEYTINVFTEQLEGARAATAGGEGNLC
jgi:hypothetical protein